MSELERARRLPVFIDEEQWERAFKAAKLKVDFLYASGLIDVPSGHVNGRLHDAAVQIATAALRAAAQEDEGDVRDLPGVTVSQIPSHTASYHPTVRTLGHQRGRITVRPGDPETELELRADGWELPR